MAVGRGGSGVVHLGIDPDDGHAGRLRAEGKGAGVFEGGFDLLIDGQPCLRPVGRTLPRKAEVGGGGENRAGAREEAPGTKHPTEWGWGRLRLAFGLFDRPPDARPVELTGMLKLRRHFGATEQAPGGAQFVAEGLGVAISLDASGHGPRLVGGQFAVDKRLQIRGFLDGDHR